jgi:transcriptional regulator with XRE-family HTH domain
VVTRSAFTKKADDFRLLLIEERKRIGLTQAELAERLSRPQSFISKVERGERRLDVLEFFELAKALRIDPISFLSSFFRTESTRTRSK